MYKHQISALPTCFQSSSENTISGPDMSQPVEKPVFPNDRGGAQSLSVGTHTSQAARNCTDAPARQVPTCQIVSPFVLLLKKNHERPTTVKPAQKPNISSESGILTDRKVERTLPRKQLEVVKRARTIARVRHAKLSPFLYYSSKLTTSATSCSSLPRSLISFKKLDHGWPQRARESHLASSWKLNRCAKTRAKFRHARLSLRLYCSSKLTTSAPKKLAPISTPTDAASPAINAAKTAAYWSFPRGPLMSAPRISSLMDSITECRE